MHGYVPVQFLTVKFIILCPAGCGKPQNAADEINTQTLVRQ
jgi:hypothetical protein